MDIFGVELSKYSEVFKTPFLIVLGWSAVSLAMSFVFLDVHMVMETLSFPLYLALGLYLGMRLKKSEIEGRGALVGGALFGVLAGLIIGIQIAALIFYNETIRAFYDEPINKAIEGSKGAITYDEMIVHLAIWSVLLLPLIWGLLMAVLSVIGSFLAKYIKKPEPTPLSWEEEKKKEAVQETTPTISKKRPPKKFRKRK